MFDTQLSGDGTGAATQDQCGSGAWSAFYLQLFPRNAQLDSGTESLRTRLLCGEARGKTLSGAGPCAAIRDFLRGKNALKKPASIALNGASDAIDLDQIDSGSDQHDATVAQREIFSSAMVQIVLKTRRRYPIQPVCARFQRRAAKPEDGS